MAIDRTSFGDVAEADLLALITTGVTEGLLIEFKRDAYGAKDADVKEFLKDVSSFANSSGGHLLMGMEANKGIAAKLAPLTGDADAKIARLDNMMRDGIEPRINSQVRAVPVLGGFVILIRVARSWNPPHRVSARGSNRIYARNSAGVHEVSMDELRSLFALGATATEQARRWRDTRLAAIVANHTPVPLAAVADRLCLHIAPLAAFASSRPAVDLTRALSLDGHLRPLGSTSYSPRLNFEGLIVYRGGEFCHGYTQLFRNGLIEATKVRILMDREGVQLIPSLDFEQNLINAFPRYMDGLKELGVSPPFLIMITLDGVRGARLGISRGWLDEAPLPIPYSQLQLPEILIEDFGLPGDYHRALKPAFDTLWNSAGLTESQYYDPEDKWVGRKTPS